MRKIITSERVRIENVEVQGLEALSAAMKAWVQRQRRELVKTATLPEKLTARMLSRFSDKPTRQAFFMIRKRCYFLDFFFPERMVAVEIDGSSHMTRKAHDRQRDADFRSIGIRTIRIKNKDVMGGKLYDKLFKGLYK